MENLEDYSNKQLVPINSTTGYTGVIYHKKYRKYSVCLWDKKDKKQKFIGYYKTLEEAASMADYCRNR